MDSPRVEIEKIIEKINELNDSRLNYYIIGIIEEMAQNESITLEEGNVLATIANSISKLVEGKNPFGMALIIYLIILCLEFFISSSTAKAIFVMGILSTINISLSKELMVLLYLN